MCYITQGLRISELILDLNQAGQKLKKFSNMTFFALSLPLWGPANTNHRQRLQGGGTLCYLWFSFQNKNYKNGQNQLPPPLCRGFWLTPSQIPTPKTCRHLQSRTEAMMRLMGLFLDKNKIFSLIFKKFGLEKCSFS